MALSALASHLHGEHDGRYVFELAAAAALGLTPWHRLPPDAVDRSGASRWCCAASCASPDLTALALVRWGDPGAGAVARRVGEFDALAETLDAPQRIMVRGEGEPLYGVEERLASDVLELTAEMIGRICEQASDICAAPTDTPEISCDYNIVLPICGKGDAALAAAVAGCPALGSVLVYCADEAAAGAFADQLNGAGAPAARAAGVAADEFAARCRCLVAAGGAVVGAAADTILIADGAASLAPQRVLDALKLSRGKTIINIMLPTAHEHAWATLRALGDADPRLAASVAGGGRGRIDTLACGAHPEGFAEQQDEQLRDRAKLCLTGGALALPDKIPGQEWKPLPGDDCTWMRHYKILVSYVDKFNEQPTQYTWYLASNVGVWASRQRIAYSKGLLSEGRIALLESVAGWSWDLLSDRWSANYKKLLSHVAEFKKLPKYNSSYRNTRLGLWATNMRRCYKNGKLTEERVALLEKIPGWSWNTHDNMWAANYKLFLEYMAEFNELPNQRAVYRGRKIGEWARKQRARYRGGKLPSERVALLNEIPGWIRR